MRTSTCTQNHEALNRKACADGVTRVSAALVKVTPTWLLFNMLGMNE